MANDSTRLRYEPLPLRSHLATAMLAMSLVFASGTLFSWLRVRDCDGIDCSSLPPAVTVLLSLGITTTLALFAGSLLLWAPLQHNVGPAEARK